MAGGEDSFEERTEEATPQRREEWKKEGRVVQSRELTGAMLLIAIVGSLWAGARYAVGGIWRLTEDLLGELARGGARDWNIAYVMSMSQHVLTAMLYILAPVGLSALTVAIVSSVAQTGFVWSTKALEFNFEKVDPVAGMRRMVSLDGFAEMIKAILKFAVIGSVVFLFLKRRIFDASGLFDVEANQISFYLVRNVLTGLLAVGSAMFVLAAFDFGYQKFRFEQKIRMTKQEVKEERRQSEGNPQIKARIRAIQRQRATSKMLDAVKKADVVVTNPTHIAVALQYDRDNMMAPKVVAKGADYMAEKIKKIARENGIPCVENVPLARAMFKAFKIGQFISRDLYNAVAEVLAYVYRLKGRVNV